MLGRIVTHRAAPGLALAAVLLTAAVPARSEEPVDLALVLAVDSSGSVNPYEFNLQMRGLAKAFRSPGVVNAIRSAAPHGIAVTLIQWSSIDEQGQAFDWIVVRDAATAEWVAGNIDATPRMVKDGATAISHAIDYAARLVLSVDAARRVIDVSGDGRDNQSDLPLPARVRAVAAGITVNGLAILNEDPMLEYYYLSEVIGGEGAFVLGADDYDDFAEAIEIKLIKEISNAPLSQRPREAPSYAGIACDGPRGAARHPS